MRNFLRNIAVYEGTANTMLACSADTNGSSWMVRPVSNSASDSQITKYDDTVSPTLTNLYAYNRSGLIVRSATMSNTSGPISTAGFYIVNFNSTARRAVKLTVISSAPTCSCNEFSSGVNLTCTITYADHPLGPISPLLSCTANGQQYANAITTKTPLANYVSTYTVTITVNNTFPTAYDCLMTLSTPAATDLMKYPFLAQNTPDFSATFTVCDISGGITQTSITNPRTVAQPSTTAIKPLAIGGLSDGGGKIGIGVGVAVGGLIVVCGILLCVFRKRHQSIKGTKPDNLRADGMHDIGAEDIERSQTPMNNVNTQRYEPLNIRSAQNGNAGPTYDQLITTTAAHATELYEKF